jgi:hypothetical protein
MANLSRENLIYEVQTKSKSIALIYSPLELNEYIVEIISKTSELFIRKNNNISHFHSVNDAISHAAKYGAKEFFLCVDNTYDECGLMASSQHFDYIPIHSK